MTEYKRKWNEHLTLMGRTSDTKNSMCTQVEKEEISRSSEEDLERRSTVILKAQQD